MEECCITLGGTVGLLHVASLANKMGSLATSNYKGLQSIIWKENLLTNSYHPNCKGLAHNTTFSHLLQDHRIRETENSGIH